jgi:DNA-3-methyladenine glycosylase I
MSSYCDYAQGHDLHGPYHDTEYGFPIEDESQLFERLLLEINQAMMGSTWTALQITVRGTASVCWPTPGSSATS